MTGRPSRASDLELNERVLAVAPGNNQDACPLCGIHRENAGYLRDTCGPHYLQAGCFVVQENPRG